MPGITSLLEKVSIKIPYGFRDIISTVGGLGFLMGFYLTHYYTYIISKFTLKPNPTGLNSLERDVLVLIIAYFIGKFLVILSNVILDIYDLFIFLIKFLLNPEVRIKLFDKLKRGWRKELVNFFDYGIDIQPLTKEEVSYEVSSIDIDSAIRDNPAVADDMERSIYRMILLQLTYTVAFLGIFLSRYYIIIFLAFFIFYLQEMKWLNKKKYAVYRFVVRNHKSLMPEND